MSDKYSQQEIKLFTALGYKELINTPIEPLRLYRLCVEKAFINNWSGPHIEALRKGFKSLGDCYPYRMTKEFDDLIAFD